MNLTFVLPNGMEVGGVTTWSIEMAHGLAAAGRAACLLEHVNTAITGCEVEIPSGVRLLQHYGHRPVQVCTVKNIHQYTLTYQKALPGVIIPNYSFGTYAACAALARQQASQLRVLGFAHADQPYYYNLLACYEPLVHLFVAVSQEVTDALAKRLPHRRSDIRLRPYGVRVAAALERTYSPPHAPIQLVYAGRLVEIQKRVSDLITLASALGQRGVDFDLRIVGEGAEEKLLREGVQRLPLSVRERVHFAGAVPHDRMPGVWRAADICVLVSEYEGTSIAMLEAMVAGCVPVVTRVSGTAAAIAPGENGYLVNVGDVAEMARIVQMLALERDRLIPLGREARRTVAERFSLSAYVDWFLALANEAWEQPPRPWPARRALVPLTTTLYIGWMIVSTRLWRTRYLCKCLLNPIASTIGRKNRTAA